MGNTITGGSVEYWWRDRLDKWQRENPELAAELLFDKARSEAYSERHKRLDPQTYPEFAAGATA